MEQRLARGEVPQIPIPATPPHMKQAAEAESAKSGGGSQKFSLQEAKQFIEKLESRGQCYKTFFLRC